MDIYDKASEIEEMHRNAAIANQQAKSNCQGTSAFECEECGDVIPEARRQAIIGCRCCVQCQEEIDSYGKTRFA